MRVFTRCFGTPPSAEMYGRFISVVVELDSSIFAFSAASFSRCIAIGSFVRSMPSSALKPFASQSMITWSKSSPPRCVSPFVDSTSNTPPPNSSIDISNVPPPRSKTAIFISLLALSTPYASAAAVGSFTIRCTFSPAICPASFVACRCESEK